MSEFRHISNKKILVLANYDIGLYKFRKALLEELIRSGNEVYISLPYGDLVPELEKLGCKFVDTVLERRGMNPLKDMHLYRQYRKMLKSVKPDLVITYTIKPNIYGGFACRLAKIPCAVNITGLGSAVEGGGLLQKLVFAMYRTGIQKAETVFFENEGNRDVLLHAGVVKKEKTCVLHGAGIDTDEYACAPYPMEEPLRFLFVGRIMQEKGVDELFAAVHRLKAEYGDRVVCEMVGMFEESYQVRIEKLVKDGVIRFHGYQQNVKLFYANAHCVVLPSWHEGMSNVLLEGAATGRPLITSDVHGCMEAVEDGISGYLCHVKDAESLYQAMKRFCELSYEERKNMGLAGRKRMEELFDKKQVVKETIIRINIGK
ncbi:MAG: glycosyltransferase family 4 protein [Clostridia bacterium]|nr:glycosyltransferase family 4 protein [Clostridia bacterium]